MKYDPVQANRIANNLAADANNWLSIYTKLNNIIAEMDRAFVSQTQTAFSAANDSNTAKYIKMKNLLEEMSTALKNAQNKMVQADEAEAQRIRSRFRV